LRVSQLCGPLPVLVALATGTNRRSPGAKPSFAPQKALFLQPIVHLVGRSGQFVQSL
jgi:hypothetical protein